MPMKRTAKGRNKAKDVVEVEEMEATPEDDEELLDDEEDLEGEGSGAEEQGESLAATLLTPSSSSVSIGKPIERTPSQPEARPKGALVQVLRDMTPHGPTVGNWSWREAYPDKPCKANVRVRVPVEVAEYLREVGAVAVVSS